MADGLLLGNLCRVWGKKVSGILGLLGVVLAATLLSILLVPAKEAGAFFTYGTQLSYQQNDSSNGISSTSTSEERFSFYFNLNSNPFSRLTMAGIIRFDVLEDKRADGTTSTELQPNADFRFSTKAVQLGVGHREILRNENIISANETQTQTTNETDSYVEASLIAGRLPNLRVRYSIRNDSQDRAGFTVSNIATDDLLLSMNYRLGIFLINADYRDEVSHDKVTGVTTESSQVTGQVSVSRRIGSKIDLSLRENYNLNENTASNAPPTRQSTSSSEARSNFILFKGATVSTSYIYRLSDDSTTGTTTEKTWAATANYALPKFLRFYGSYVSDQSDSPGASNSTTNTVAGASYSQSLGRLAFAGRYEMRFDTNESTSAGVTNSSSDSQDNLDWAVTARLARFLGLLLSESFVSNSAVGVTTDTNHFRFRADIGPLKALTLGPYVEYTVTSSSNVAGSTTATAVVVPAAFHVNLHQKLDLTITDTYNLNINTAPGAPTASSSNNNAVLRLTLARPFPNTSLSGDASFTTNWADNTPTTSSSIYAIRGSWSKSPHVFNANFSYQTATGSPDSLAFAAQYGLNFRLKKLFMGLQARYDYQIVLATPASTSQAIYALINLRK